VAKHFIENITDHLDPAYYFATQAFSFDAMLKYTRVKLKLLSDYEMLLMFEDGKQIETLLFVYT